MKRRKFIQHTAASASFIGAGGLSLSSCSGAKTSHITILHTNDVHSHIDAFPKDHSSFAGLGGLARRAGLVNAIRKENPNTLLFDAGDIFQGTPYFNFYGGELEMKLMTMLNYDAATIGNHDFDNGIEGLLAQIPYGKFDFVSSNYDFSNTVLAGFTKPFQTYERDGVKIGVYGLGIQLKGLVTKTLYKETRYLDPYEIANDLEQRLKDEEKCDLVICLSHLGYSYEDENKPDDLKLAAKTKHTDLIIGGHTHTFLDKPSIVKNAMGKEVLVNQVGCYGVNLGRIDFYLDTNGITTNGVSIKV
ncbi:metallophosphatase [Maribacter sp. 4U21]|uniref:bifunctional metallophosphatase/5'-nucleotidase n=1 Tax=Maribacter sp. 4U21 TaxID=1889779 RepID=UPI000C155E9A|nr:metallophosphatase [Maribacter sp. 4U21]PIB23883.1 metallophosphatase [Maribacter sp. 4U21]